MATAQLAARRRGRDEPAHVPPTDRSRLRTPSPPVPGVPAPAGFPRTARALRDALAAHGVAPAKRHGQCFLTDVQAIDAIVRDAEVGPDDAVLEVGTGTGLLTHALAEAGASIDTFDIDPRVQALARGFRAWPERVRFHLVDVLEGKHAPRPSVPRGPRARARARVPAGPVKVVSNLPYNVATLVPPRRCSRSPDPPDAITVMVQLEVAEKLLGSTGDDDYGPALDPAGAPRGGPHPAAVPAAGVLADALGEVGAPPARPPPPP